MTTPYIYNITITIGDIIKMESSSRRKLSINEQIEDMLTKGISFEHTSIEDAKKFLTNNNYYFKLKSYERNYDKYHSTEKARQYINLDFAYLQELSTIDMYLRKLILSLALDIEHALKVQIVRDISNNPSEDGFSIVKDFFNFDYMNLKSIEDKASTSAVGDLIKARQKTDNDYALWEVVEVLSFGKFIDLYSRYYSRYNSPDDYSSYLWSVRFLRNAAAHNNCIINSIKAPYNISLYKNKDILFIISRIKGLSEKSRSKWMSNPVVHDFVILVFLFLNVVKSEGIKESGIEQIKRLINERMPLHKEYFTKNDSICECYRFTQRIISYFCNKYRK